MNRTVSSLAGEWFDAVSKVVSLNLSQNGPFQNINLLDTYICSPLVASSVEKKYRTSSAQTGSSKTLKYCFGQKELTPGGRQKDSMLRSDVLSFTIY